jgi:hypothetical protein
MCACSIYMHSYAAALENETACSPEGPLAQLARTPESAAQSPRHVQQSKVGRLGARRAAY